MSANRIFESGLVLAAERAVDLKELRYMAFTGQYEKVHALYKRIVPEERPHYANEYVLSEVIYAGIRKLHKLLAEAEEQAADIEKAFIDEVVALFIETCRSSKSAPRELFQALLNWCEELYDLSLPDEALAVIEAAHGLGIDKFPDLQACLLLKQAMLLKAAGHITAAHELLARLAEKPYLVSDRNLLPDILFNLGKTALMTGEVRYYKTLLFRGLRYFYTGMEERRLFSEQILKTYRKGWQVLLSGEIGIPDRLLFGLHWLYFKFSPWRIFRSTGLARLFRLALLGYVYALNYFGTPAARPGSSRQSPASGSQPRFTLRNGRPAAGTNLQQRPLLVTRTMGGIGDLLMMTPGLHALKRQHPGREIHLAIPRRYFSVFQHNPDVTLLDIEDEQLDRRSYHRWFNFSDCPAARVEALTAPKVKKNRIALFARGLGIRGRALRRMDRRPRYFISGEEQQFAEQFRRNHGLNGKTIIAVQIKANETYRDYPHMPQLVELLARTYTVLLFDGAPIEGFDHDNVLKIDYLPLRKSLALAATCDLIVAPDSAFVHFAGALDIPCVALYGPVDGKVRTADYPNCTYLDVRHDLRCVPCWRNEQIPCKLTGMRGSICMLEIQAGQVYQTVQRLLNQERNHETIQQSM